MKISLPSGVTRQLGRTVLQAKKNSPHIFFGLGVVSVAGATILACRATLKLERELDEIKKDVDNVKSAEGITDQERQRLLAVKYGRGVGRLARLYGPAAVLGVAGIGALAGSHVQLTRRNTAVSGALALVSQAYDDYRGRVREEYGEDKERELYHGVTSLTETVDGKKKTLKELSKDSVGKSPYARIFDETSMYWQNDPEHNLMFLRCQEQYWNDRLYAYGHVFLNEVYEALGFDHTRHGQVVGWLRDKKDPNAKRIDFGVYSLGNGRFVNGMEKSVVLDFNVDAGTIYDKI